MPIVTQDATSGIWVPASAAEWTSFVSGLGIGNLLALYQCQDVASPAVDSINAINLAGAAIAWQATLSGWTRKAIQWSEGTNEQILNVSSASLPDLSTTSMTIVALLEISATPAATRSVLLMGPGSTESNNVVLEVNTSNEYRITDGTNMGVGTVNHGTSVVPVILRHDVTHGTQAVFVGFSPEKISKTFVAPAGGSKGIWIADAYNFSPSMSAVWIGILDSTAAEMTDAQADGLANAFQAGPVVVSIAVSPSSFTLGLPGDTQQLTAIATRADGSTFDITSEATWVSSTTAAATVSSSGLVTAVAGGTSTITASFTSLGASAATPGSSACTVTGFVPSTYTPPTLFDPVPGNIGLIGDSIVLLHLNEPAGVFPADASGNLNNLGSDTGTTMPTPIACWADDGRRFGQSTPDALYSTDATDGDTLELRDVSVQCILAPTFAGASGAQTIIQRGDHDGTAGEPIAYGLEILEPASGQIEFRWFWEDSAGTIHTQAGGVYVHPGDGEFVLLTATRRWNSTTSVTCRYYAADQLLGEITSTNGDIAGGTTGHMMVGGRKTSGSWSNFLNADLDELRVVDYEMSADEVRATWARLSIHQPNGVAMFAGLQPRGSKWFADPGNGIGRMTKATGEILGYAISLIEELRENWLPDQAYAEWITRWEAALKLSAKPRDSLDTRRARVIAFLSRLRGYSAPAIAQILSEPLQLATSDIQLLRFSNRITDALSSINAQRWSAGPMGTWSIASSQLQIAETADLSEYPSNPCGLQMSIPASNLPRVTRFGAGAIVAQVELASITSLPNNAVIGLFLFDRVSNDALWFGVEQAGVHRALGYILWQGGVHQGFVQLLALAPSTPIWLRVRPQTLQDVMFTPLLGYSTTSAVDGFTETTGTSFTLNPPNNAGVGVLGLSGVTTALQATFADFRLLAYRGDRPFRWYAYRDPSLAGSPDIVGAQLALAGAKPAHTYAGVCQNMSVLCDDTRDGLCDRGPLGGL